MEKLVRYKMVLFGTAGVGKTSLVDRFIHNKFEVNYISTLGYNVYEKQISHGNYTISLMIYDIGGQEQFRELRKKYAQGSSTALIVYDITNRESFNTIPNWRDDLKVFAGEIPFIIVGNKVDLEADRQVSKEDGTQLCDQLGALNFIETSAKTGEAVEDAFTQLAVKTYEVTHANTYSPAGT